MNLNSLTPRDAFVVSTFVLGPLLALLLRLDSRDGVSLFPLSLLAFATVSLRLAAAFADPFLNLWDEQVHALVARHMIESPPSPVLYRNPLLPFDYTIWTANNVWLHKPPLPLWQISLSLSIAGLSEVAVRLPSVFLNSATVCLVYRLGSLLFSSSVGFLAALLTAFSFYELQLVAGAVPTDHVDVALLFYLTLGMLIWARYEFRPSRQRALVLGAVLGAAFLSKLMVAFLLYPAWIIASFPRAKSERSMRVYGEILIAFVVSSSIGLSWLGYTLLRFPREALHELKYTQMHLSQAIEGHSGGPLYHLNALRDLYGPWLPWLLPFAIPLALYRLPTRSLRLGVGAYLFVVYAFFSFAATKLESYCIIASPLVFLSLAVLIDEVLDGMRERLRPTALRISGAGLLLLVVWLDCRPMRFLRQHTFSPSEARRLALDVVGAYREIAKRKPGAEYAIFNTPKWYSISGMFYTNGVAYDRLPTEPEVRDLRSRGIPLIVFDDGRVPDFLRDDAEIVPAPWHDRAER